MVLHESKSNNKFSSKAMSSSYSRVSNTRGRRNKRGGWQISPKIINGETAITGGRLAKISKVNERGGWNKRGDWQKHSN